MIALAMLGSLHADELAGVRLLGLQPTGPDWTCDDGVCTRDVEALGRPAKQTVTSRCNTVLSVKLSWTLEDMPAFQEHWRVVRASEDADLTFLARSVPKDGNPPPSLAASTAEGSRHLGWMRVVGGGAIVTQETRLGLQALGVHCSD